jgi:hypothetical protein
MGGSEHSERAERVLRRAAITDRWWQNHMKAVTEKRDQLQR